MLPIQVLVKYVDRFVDMDLIEPRDCSVISVINDAKKFFEDRLTPVIEFELILVPNAIHFPEDDPRMLCFNEPVEEDNVEPVEKDSEEENVGGDALNDGSDMCSVDNEYEVGKESEDDSDVSLVDENGDKDYRNKDHYQPDGIETAVIVSFDEETALTRIARYC
ncbi:hypothetical protein QYF36_001166 [Acer negundo]|nr:hypothetical protein QYF36_001166 [Acer negundo]